MIVNPSNVPAGIPLIGEADGGLARRMLLSEVEGQDAISDLRATQHGLPLLPRTPPRDASPVPLMDRDAGPVVVNDAVPGVAVTPRHRPPRGAGVGSRGPTIVHEAVRTQMWTGWKKVSGGGPLHGTAPGSSARTHKVA